MAAAEADAPALRVEVVYSPGAALTERVLLRMPAGSTVLQAFQRSGLAERFGLTAEASRLGVWGRPAPAAQPLRDLDRVEVYRPLQVDPKEARRLRYRGQRQRRPASAGGR